ncbi:MAG: hypothetical protein C4583_06110 [Anaerolineaceae bacterium]|nr:MAG: hypothetical protein C4583_06110 [Anaerolineaceae bacterium]
MFMLKKLSDFLKRGLPAKSEMFLVLSTAAFLIFTWSVRTLFFNFPAFLLSYTIGEILVIAAYMLAFALFETLLATLLLIIMSALLPGGIFKEGFSYKASFFLIAFGAVSIHMQNVMTNQPTTDFLLLELGRALTLWLVPVLLTRYVNVVRKIVLDILDRLIIFSYIYLPLGIVSLLVVAFRLLW